MCNKENINSKSHMMKLKPDVTDKVHPARQRSGERIVSRMERTEGQEVIVLKEG